MTSKTVIAILVASWALVACAPKTPMVEVSPDRETATFNDGKGNEVVTKTGEDGSTEIEGTTSDGKSFSMSSKKSIDLTEFGLKEYPNIIPNEATTQNNLIEGERGKTISLLFSTKDSITEVTDFYDSQITSKNKSITKTPDGTIIGGETTKGASMAIIISKSGNDTQVSITGGTN